MTNKRTIDNKNQAFNIFDKSLDDEMKMEERRNFLLSNKKLIISIVVAIITGMVFVQSWKSHLQSRQKIVANNFYNLKCEYYNNNRSSALELSKIIANDKASDGYATLARFVQAGILAESSSPECLAIYKEIAFDKKVSRFFSDFAFIRYVNISLDIKSADALENEINEMISHLGSIISQKSPWDLYARLSLAYCYLKMEKYDLALQTLEELDSIGISVELRDRVSTLINFTKQKIALQRSELHVTDDAKEK